MTLDGVARITITAESRMALGRAYLALLDQPHDARRRGRTERAMERYVAKLVPPEDKHERLADLPRIRTIDLALQPWARRLSKTLNAAHRLIAMRGEPTPASRRLTPPEPSNARTKGREDGLCARDSYRRHLAPILPVLHLALPIAARWIQPQMFRRRYPELAPNAIPPPGGWLLPMTALLLDERWPPAALDAAERWRQALHFPGTVEVRARWLD